MNRYDMLELSARLSEQLKRVLPCEAHALYFPQEDRGDGPVWLPEESRLLLPLRREGELLGVFMARGLDAGRVEALLPELPAIVSLCLDNLELYLSGRHDALTGLLTRAVLRESLNRETESIRASFESSQFGGAAEGALGLLLVRFGGMENVIRESGYDFSEKLMAGMAQKLKECMPARALCARSGEHELAALVPGGDRAACEKLSLELVHRLQEVMLPDPYTDRLTGVTPYAGYAVFPQDIDGGRFSNVKAPAVELLRKAGLAADAARQFAPGQNRVMGYGRLLMEGGLIRRLLPLDCVEVSLGRGEGAREGQSFSVWSAGKTPGQPVYKGDIVLQEVRETVSVAEVLHLGDVANPMQPGDFLRLLPAGRGSRMTSLKNVEEESGFADSGLYRHRDFLSHLARMREGCASFALSLVHLPFGGSDAAFGAAVRLCREFFHNEGWENVLGGRFALNSLIFFHPNAEGESLKGVYGRLCPEIEGLGRLSSGSSGMAAAGIAVWPFLHYTPGEMVECARKALEYALLLPAPHVGVFDSVALNISGDKRQCRGDVFGAMEEYKLALLANPENTLARNALGVCLAGLGRHDAARKQFERALLREPNDAALAYNLGTACQRLGDIEAARQNFSRCLELEPSHLYAQLRLGLLAEQEGKLEEAEPLYLGASESNPESALPHRLLARIALHTERVPLAREQLYKALLLDPRDAESLALMARLYLDGGEDAELAESLARQSVALRPEKKSGWLVLGQALEARGLAREAREAFLKAESL